MDETQTIERYYRVAETQISSGLATWVRNFEVGADQVCLGFFYNGNLSAVVRHQRDAAPPCYPMVYEINEGKPKPIKTTIDIYQAIEFVESRYLPEKAVLKTSEISTLDM